MVKITPDLLTMESETVLTQYIIMNWTLAYKNMSKTLQILQWTEEIMQCYLQVTRVKGSG